MSRALGVTRARSSTSFPAAFLTGARDLDPVNRRQFVVASASACACGSAVALAGCVGGRGDSITMLAVNQDDTRHRLTVWVVRGERLHVAETVDVAPGDVERLGGMPPDDGSGVPYRVTVRMDGDPVLVREFRPDRWFNQLDVVISSDGAVELNRGRAA
jgi:hypothetical protein